ncbi:MAG: hypothetical protein LH660_06355 [Phormidesmis sp. CAN_BIN36]|nr:hypothetical protein [Phormidesmis sp. CAN_BIN36]
MNDRFHTEDSRTPGFPIWAYLNQPLFHPAQPFFARPRQFWRYHNIQQLEHCWIRSELHLLEHCWRQDLNAEEQ